MWCHPAIRPIVLEAFEKAVKHSDESENGAPELDLRIDVKVEDLRDELNRFRLTGPLAVRVLCEALTQDTTGLDVGLKTDAAYYNAFWALLGRNSLSASSLTQVSS